MRTLAFLNLGYDRQHMRQNSFCQAQFWSLD